jgi:histidine triad (HIT) family protein
MSKTLFERIISREIPADIVFENEELLAFRISTRSAPVHVLLVPKRVVARVDEAQRSDRELLGNLLLAAAQVRVSWVWRKMVTGW